MIVRNMISPKGNYVPNQYVININTYEIFQSYRSIIIINDLKDNSVYLNKDYYDYSNTTSRYRNIFLGITTKEMEQKIKQKEFILIPNDKIEYKLANLIKPYKEIV